MKNVWLQYIGERVRLMIEEHNGYPKPKDGVVEEVTETHIFLKIEGKEKLVPFLLTTIRRIDIKEDKEKEEHGGYNTR